MARWSIFSAFKANNQSANVAWGMMLIVLIALFDWRVTEPIPLGFLYLVPMFLFGRVLGPWPIALIAAACAGFAEAYDGFPLTLYTGLSRMILYFAAFVTTGLFVREIHRNRERTLVHLHEIEAQRDAISEAEKQLKSLIESSPAAIVTADANGHILMANEAAHRLLGVSHNSLATRLIRQFLPSLANVGQAGDSNPRFRAVMQARGFREDGEAFLADICFSTYPTASGVRLTAMIVDNSEDLRQHEESSLHQLMVGSRLAVGAMSHEIRNICAAIAVVHQNLSRNGLLHSSADFESLGSLVHTLENVAAIELRFATAQSSAIDLPAVLDDLRIVVSPSLRDEGIVAYWTFDADLPMVWGDRSQLMQIFLNLTTNSIRALSDRDCKELYVTARSEPNRVVIEFCDTGGGVKDPESLFHPFQEGAIATGLGLYLSRAFARSFGGDLRYWPKAGQACFIIELMRVVPTRTP